MPDANAILQVLRDPNLQTGPYPQWPTLPPMQQPQPHYLENDPTPWQGGDFPTHPSAAGILTALLGAKAGMRGGTAQSTRSAVVPGMFRAEESRATGEPEVPFAPAVKIGERIYTGEIHDFAVEKARQELGQPAINNALNEETMRANAALAAGLSAPISNFSGFLTNKGRYVSREEAAAMVPQANRSRIHSSDLPRYNKEGQ